MAFHHPMTVELFDKDDQPIGPVTRPVSITQNFESHDFNYIAVQVETRDQVMRDVLERWNRGELVQYRLTGRFGMDTGDINSIYGYETNTGEFSFYGRSHKEILKSVLGFPEPTNPNPRTQKTTHKTYTGSALAVMRQVLTDNLVNRLGVPMTFQSGDLGNQVTIDFRFDEIHGHFYEDSKEKGGALLETEGNIVFNITRDFKAKRYVLTAREPVHHEMQIEVRSGFIERWQLTAERAAADHLIIGGPGEMLERHFWDVKRDELRHRRFRKEVFTEHTNPETGAKAGTDPTTAQIQAALDKYAVQKLAELDGLAAVSAQLTESDALHLGGGLELGDWVRIGVDEHLSLGEQQIEKAVATWTRDDGYRMTLNKPEGSETPEAKNLARVNKILRDFMNITRRR